MIEDKNTEILKILRDGSKICLVINAANEAFITTVSPEGREEGSLHITSEETKEKRIIEAVTSHYTYNRRSAASFKTTQETDDYVGKIIRDMVDIISKLQINKT